MIYLPNLNPHRHHNPQAVVTMVASALFAMQMAYEWKRRGGRHAYWLTGCGAVLALILAIIAGRIHNGYWF